MPTIKINKEFSPQFYEREAWKTNESVFGVDEVGRGCLAGPVVTAAVLLEPHARHKLLKDSKVLTEKERLSAYKWLMKHSKFAVSFINHRTIDSVNIYQATLKAMKRATYQLMATTAQKPRYILVDAMPLRLNDPELTIVHFNFGEQKSSSIAAASIIAKVTRDALMGRMEEIIPHYSFKTHKGYATKKHREIVQLLGATIVHRESFLSHVFNPEEELLTQQLMFVEPPVTSEELSDEHQESIC